MRACDLRVPPEMAVEDLIPFLQGIVYAEKFYKIEEAPVQEKLNFEEMEAEE